MTASSTNDTGPPARAPSRCQVLAGIGAYNETFPERDLPYAFLIGSPRAASLQGRGVGEGERERERETQRDAKRHRETQRAAERRKETQRQTETDTETEEREMEKDRAIERSVQVPTLLGRALQSGLLHDELPRVPTSAHTTTVSSRKFKAQFVSPSEF